jgi:2-polyprenyl-3-methyl-5-hydroxy-6-metoxy-1,4-benzoquinol methylase
MRWFERTHEDRYKQAAIDYPRKLHGDRKAYLYTKPFGTDPWGDDFCGKFHDFAHLVEMFRLPPGASILDVGCGPGWLSEYFARLGYRATGIDISPDMIETARERIRRLGFPEGGKGIQASFAVMDSEGFQLDQQFDAAVVYDALHHFEDERAVLRTVFAHLKPGGRLFMKEPQAHHPDAPETRAEVAEFGVLERGFTREQLVTSLTDAGFLPPVVLRQADMMLDEGRLAPGYIGAVMASTPVYHLLLAAKPGPGAIDSRWPGSLDAALSVTGLPARLAPGTSVEVEVTATNTGDTLWLHRPMRYGGHVRLGAQLLGEDRSMIAPDFASLFMPRDVAPGESITLRVPIRAPDVAGRYILRFDLVDEFITWFRDRGSRPFDASVDVA